MEDLLHQRKHSRDENSNNDDDDAMDIDEKRQRYSHEGEIERENIAFSLSPQSVHSHYMMDSNNVINSNPDMLSSSSSSSSYCTNEHTHEINGLQHFSFSFFLFLSLFFSFNL